MEPKATSRFLRAVLVVAVLIIVVASGTFEKGRSVSAKSCEEAFIDYLDASFEFETARVNYFYGLPVSCEDECEGSPNRQQCIDACRSGRHTTLGQAELSMFNMALDTCTPASINQCSQAQTMANSCLSQHNAANYSDPEEAAAVDAQYWACIEASKIDSCR